MKTARSNHRNWVKTAFAGLLDEGEAALARAGAFLRAHFQPAL
jgi:hypothetical protein